MSTYFIIEAGTLILSKPETTALTLELLRHYFYFSSCPETFDLYSSNAGYLGEPLLELLVFGLLSPYSSLFKSADLINPCEAIELSRESLLTCDLKWH